MNDASRGGWLAQFLRFGVVGVANTLIGAGLTLLLAWRGMDPYLANVIGYVAGTLFSFVVNTKWTFRAPLGGRRLVLFLLVTAGAYGVNVLVLALALAAGWGPVASQVPAMVCFTISNFLGQRHITFANREETP